MAKAIFFEDMDKHRCSLKDNYTTMLEYIKYQAKSIQKLEDCLVTLKGENIDVVIIHHSDFSQVDAMREISPNTRYIGVSGDIYFNPNPGSIGEAFNIKILMHYDAILGASCNEDFEKIVKGQLCSEDIDMSYFNR